jgi:two-component system, LuxR family, response regulator FixJ
LSTAGPVVFIVDDDEAVRDSLAVMLESHGLEVWSFDSAQAFLQALVPGWQGCLLLDIKMPMMDGRELQRELARRGCRLPIVFVTGHGDVPMAVEAMKAGAADFIEKPLDPDVVLESVQRQLRAPGGHRDETDPELAPRHARLTPREMEVMLLVVRGLQNKQIAYELGVSPRTIELHRARVMEKMQARNLPTLTRMALALGILAD